MRAVGIESDKGFEIGIELVAKARRARLPVAEIPTIWLDRAFGVSNFKLAAWLPSLPPLVPATPSAPDVTSRRLPSTKRPPSTHEGDLT